ncbi:MAG: hypothetical protein ACQERB_08445 [Promethearchaeati archaeon]
MTEYYCYNCEKFVRVAHDRSAFLMFVLIVLGFISFGIGIILAIIYHVTSPRICLECKQKTLEELPNNMTKKEFIEKKRY